MHIVIIAIVLSVIFLTLSRHILATLPLIAAILLALWVWDLHFSVQQRSRNDHAFSRPLKLIEFNILSKNRQGGKIADWLTRQDADVIYTLESAPLLP